MEDITLGDYKETDFLGDNSIKKNKDFKDTNSIKDFNTVEENKLQIKRQEDKKIDNYNKNEEATFLETLGNVIAVENPIYNFFNKEKTHGKTDQDFINNIDLKRKLYNESGLDPENYYDFTFENGSNEVNYKKQLSYEKSRKELKEQVSELGGWEHFGYSTIGELLNPANYVGGSSFVRILGNQIIAQSAYETLKYNKNYNYTYQEAILNTVMATGGMVAFHSIGKGIKRARNKNVDLEEVNLELENLNNQEVNIKEDLVNSNDNIEGNILLLENNYKQKIEQKYKQKKEDYDNQEELNNKSEIDKVIHFYNKNKEDLDISLKSNDNAIKNLEKIKKEYNVVFNESHKTLNNKVKKELNIESNNVLKEHSKNIKNIEEIDIKTQKLNDNEDLYGLDKEDLKIEVERLRKEMKDTNGYTDNTAEISKIENEINIIDSFDKKLNIKNINDVKKMYNDDSKKLKEVNNSLKKKYKIKEVKNNDTKIEKEKINKKQKEMNDIIGKRLDYIKSQNRFIKNQMLKNELEHEIIIAKLDNIEEAKLNRSNNNDLHRKVKNNESLTNEEFIKKNNTTNEVQSFNNGFVDHLKQVNNKYKKELKNNNKLKNKKKNNNC